MRSPILVLAHGKYDEFREALQLAERDWRDVLMAAGMANGDWVKMLINAGWRVPKHCKA